MRMVAVIIAITRHSMGHCAQSIAATEDCDALLCNWE